MVYAIDAGTGTQKWAYKAGGGIQQQPAVDKDVVIAASYGNDPALFALNIHTGTLKWRRRGRGSVGLLQTMASDGNLIGAGSTVDSALVCFESSTGKPKWNFGRIGYYDHPTLVGGVVYVNQVFDLSAINVATGRLVWKYATPSANFYPSTSFVIDNGLAYAIDGGGILYALDSINGARRWSYPAVNRDASPTLAGDGLYVLGATAGSTSPSKELFVLNPSTGVLRATIPLTAAPPTTRVTAFINGKAYYPGALSLYQ
jgi:outer membrane protein assembly factor BamB